MNTCLLIRPELDNLVELTSICRGEWCRFLESEMDAIESEVCVGSMTEDMGERWCQDIISRKILEGYRNLTPVYFS